MEGRAARVVNLPLLRGTLVIDIVKNESKRLVWRGWATREVDNFRSEEEALWGSVWQISRQLPLPGGA